MILAHCNLPQVWHAVEWVPCFPFHVYTNILATKWAHTGDGTQSLLQGLLWMGVWETAAGLQQTEDVLEPALLPDDGDYPGLRVHAATQSLQPEPPELTHLLPPWRPHRGHSRLALGLHRLERTSEETQGRGEEPLLTGIPQTCSVHTRCVSIKMMRG